MWLLALAGLLARVLSSASGNHEGDQQSMSQMVYYRTRDGRADYGFSIVLEKPENGHERMKTDEKNDER